MTSLTSTQNTSDTLQLDNPAFNNSDTVNLNRINRQSRGLDLIVSSESGWTPFFNRRYNWIYMSEDKRNSLIQFMLRNTGFPVTWVDMYGNSYNVVILNQDAQVAQVGRENRTVTLDMQEVQ